MPSAMISTGNVSLDTEVKAKLKGAGSAENNACHLLILGNFSGRTFSSPKQDDKSKNSALKERKIIEVDRDNFEDVFSSLKVACDLPLADGPIKFKEPDDMHPDVLYENVPLFNKFRVLKKKLKDPSTFAAAAQEVLSWGQGSDKTDAAAQGGLEDSNHSDTPASGSLLDDILGGQVTEQTNNQGDLQALVKDIIAPYLSDKPDPQSKELIKTVDDAASHLLRKLLHTPQFQSLESAWLSLYLLVRRIETSSKLKVFIADVTAEECLSDVVAEQVEDSDLYKLIVGSRAAPGATPFSAVLFDDQIGKDLESIKMIEHLGRVLEGSEAVLLAGGSEQLAGCQSLADTPDRDDWSFAMGEEITQAWSDLRSSSIAAHISLVAPRFLVRMPYGKKSSPIEAFSFEEIPDSNGHEYFLWGNGAWLALLLMAQNYTHSKDLFARDIIEVERLPLVVYQDDDETQVKPCAEVLLYDTTALAMKDAGLTVLRSVLNKDSVMLSELISLRNA